MPESTSANVVQRPGLLTYISLALNAALLLLILIGIISHHHRQKEQRDHGWGGPRMEERGWADRDREGGDFGPHEMGPPMMRHGWHHQEFGGGEHGGCPMEGDPHGFGDGMPPDGDGRPGPGGFGGMNHFQPPTTEAMTDRFMLAMSDKLQLTDPESAQIRPIVQQGIAQLQKDMEAQKEAHDKMLADDAAKIRAVLTPDQQKEFDAMMPGLNAGAPPPPPAPR
jgi:hypothetical protein